MAALIKVKKANFLHAINNNFYTSIESFKGHGITSNFNSELFLDEIINPSGTQPAVFYKTGLLTGVITDNIGSFTWPNITLTGVGESNRVFGNFVTGTVQASNIIEFIDSTGKGLENGDIINIVNFSFIFNNDPTNLSEFDSPQRLVNILNSGANGSLNNLGLSALQDTVGVTGYLENNLIKLFSFLRSGDLGNEIRIYRQSEDLNSIKIYSRYFTGGQSFRPILNNWVGNFSNTFTLTVENSGFYNKKIGPIETFGNISGVGWVNNFEQNYLVFTGLTDPRNRTVYSGQRLFFNSGLNKYSGEALMPSNDFNIYTGLNIQIFKPNPYNIEGDISEYIVSGNDFIFTDYIEG
jgi:hypothetical protein